MYRANAPTNIITSYATASDTGQTTDVSMTSSGMKRGEQSKYHGQCSGGSRNLERGVELSACKVRRKFLGCHAHFRSRERIHTKYSWKAEPRGPSQKKSRTLSDSVVLVNYNFN